MNNLIHFKMKMLIVLIFCIFMTFLMLVYVMKLTERCENHLNALCFQVSKNPIAKANNLFYNSRFNYTKMTTQLLKPFLISPENLNLYRPTIRTSNNSTKITAKQIFKALNMSFRIFNYSLKNEILKTSKPQLLQYSVRRKEQKFSFAVNDQTTINALSERERNSNDNIDSNLLVIFNKKFHSSQFEFKKNVYVERKKKLQRFCHKYFNADHLVKIKKLNLNHILIDDKHKVLYCYVPKVACTNWKRIFLVLTGKVNNISEVVNLPSNVVHAKNLFKSLQNYSIAEVLKVSEGYTKFIFVRHPFERLLSAYRNKLEQHYDSSKYFQARFGKYIIKNFRKNPSNVSLEKGDDVTFAEFANYLVSSDPNFYNEHWQRISDLCHPCLINYDFIGKYESLIEDSNFLLKYLGLNISFPTLPKPSTTAMNLNKYFNTLEKNTIYKLYNIYEMDFRLYGYDLFNMSDGLEFS